MNCDKCQTPVTEGQIFCTNCGSRIPQPRPEPIIEDKPGPTPPPTPTPTPSPAPNELFKLQDELWNANRQIGRLEKENNGKKTTIGIVLFFVIALLVTVIIMSVSITKANQRTQNETARLNETLGGEMLVKIDYFYNADKEGNEITGDLIAGNVQYLMFDFEIYPKNDVYSYYGDNLEVQIWAPNGTLMQGTDSTSTHTLIKTIDGKYNSTGWGNATGSAYGRGFYVIVFLYDGVRVGQDAVFIQ